MSKRWIAVGLLVVAAGIVAVLAWPSPPRPRVVLPRPTTKRVVRNVAPASDRVAPEPPTAPATAAADGPPGEEAPPPGFLQPPQGAPAEIQQPVPTEPVAGDALIAAAENALFNSFAVICAVQESFASGEGREDELTIEVHLDADGLAEVALLGADDLPPALAECYAEALWGTPWPKAAGGEVTMELPFSAGVGVVE